MPKPLSEISFSSCACFRTRSLWSSEVADASLAASSGFSGCRVVVCLLIFLLAGFCSGAETGDSGLGRTQTFCFGASLTSGTSLSPPERLCVSSTARPRCRATFSARSAQGCRRAQLLLLVAIRGSLVRCRARARAERAEAKLLLLAVFSSFCVRALVVVLLAPATLLAAAVGAELVPRGRRRDLGFLACRCSRRDCTASGLTAGFTVTPCSSRSATRHVQAIPVQDRGARARVRVTLTHH